MWVFEMKRHSQPYEMIMIGFLMGLKCSCDAKSLEKVEIII